MTDREIRGVLVLSCASILMLLGVLIFMIHEYGGATTRRADFWLFAVSAVAMGVATGGAISERARPNCPEAEQLIHQSGTDGGRTWVTLLERLALLESRVGQLEQVIKTGDEKEKVSRDRIDF